MLDIKEIKTEMLLAVCGNFIYVGCGSFVGVGKPPPPTEADVGPWWEAGWPAEASFLLGDKS